jgi:hypothetical protein
MNQITRLAAPSATIQYDAMCLAISAAYAVDEVKQLLDQATAIEVYARQSNNIEAERQACEIRLRATRRLGVLLEARAKAKGGQPKNPSRGASTSPKTLSDLGISYDQSARAQRLAAVPEPQFEAAIKAPGRPSTGGIIAAAAAPKVNVVEDDALWLWGRLKDFDAILARDPNTLLETMLPHMVATTKAYAPRIAAWLGRLRQ